jgi:hypothetical protein
VTQPWYQDNESEEQVAADLEQLRAGLSPEERLALAAFLVEDESTQPAAQAQAPDSDSRDEKAARSAAQSEPASRWAGTDDATLKRHARNRDAGAFDELLRRKFEAAS